MFRNVSDVTSGSLQKTSVIMLLHTQCLVHRLFFSFFCTNLNMKQGTEQSRGSLM